MKIIHSLFWIQNNMITSLLYEANGLHIIKFGGRKAVPFTETYWREWEEYAGMCSGDKTDFCLIYDEKPKTDERLMSAQCESKECIWSRTKIEEAVKLLEIKEPTEIRNENGMLLVKAGSFMNIRKEDIIPMTASYTKAEKDTESDDIPPENMTTLIKHYQGELQAYKKGYET